MSLFSTSLFGLFILNLALSIYLCECTITVSETQKPQFVLSTATSTPQEDQRKVNKEAQHEQSIIKTGTAYTNYRSKRESSEIDNDVNQQVRDFVGEPSPHEMYPLTPEQHILTPLDISGIVQYPLETSLAPEDSSLFDFDKDGFDTSDSDLQEQVWLPHEEKRLREFVGKRSVGMDTVQWGSHEKRLRDFLGKRDNIDLFSVKRLRDFVGKRSPVFDGDSIENEKRLREFVGKRNYLGDMDLTLSENLKGVSDKINNIDNGERKFLGNPNAIRRYSDTETGLREFAGNHSPYLTWIPPWNFEKRLRDFVGKRDRSETFSEDKRVREFVGKRGDTDIHNEDKRIREFIGKREDKRPREFLGKRSMFSDDEEDRIELDKKLRDFLGKRSVDEEYEEVKRLRDFVGKRLAFTKDPMELLSAVKRLRDFVGKRNNFPDLHSRAIVKRIREFIGRR